MAREIQSLRDTLFETIDAVKGGKMEVDKAKTIAEIAKVIIDSARVENDYIKSINGTAGSGFIGGTKTKQLTK